MEHTSENQPVEPERPKQGAKDTGPQSPRPQGEPGGPQSPRAEDGPAGPQSPPPESGPAGPQPPGADHPRRLVRASDDRVIAGVCGGIGHYLGVDSTVVRIAAVVLTLFGGAGAVLYLAGLLLMPQGAEPAPAAGGNRTLTIVGVCILLLLAWPLVLGGGFLAAGIVVPLALLALAGLATWWLVSGEGPGRGGRELARRAALGVGVLCLCCALAAGGALAAGLGGGTVVAGLVIASGLMLIAGAFLGGARWLIPPALSLALAVGFVAAADIDLDGGVGERDYRPTSASELRDGYRIGMGELVVDLRDVELPPGDTHVKFDVGVGAARLVVPEDVCVASTAEIGIGGVQVFGRDNGGIDLEWEDRPRADAGASRVVVDADVGVGALLVRHERSDEGPRFGRFRNFDDDVGNASCQGARAAR